MNDEKMTPELTKDMFEWVQYFMKSGVIEQIMEKVEKFEEEIKRINVLYFDKTTKYGYYHFYNDFYKIKKILREHLESHNTYYTDKEYKTTINKQLEKLDGENSIPKNVRTFDIPDYTIKKSFIKDGEKSVSQETLEMKGSRKANLGIKVNEKTDSKPSAINKHGLLNWFDINIEICLKEIYRIPPPNYEENLGYEAIIAYIKGLRKRIEEGTYDIQKEPTEAEFDCPICNSEIPLKDFKSLVEKELIREFLEDLDELNLWQLEEIIEDPDVFCLSWHEYINMRKKWEERKT